MRPSSLYPSPRPGALRALQALLAVALLGGAPLSLFADTVKMKDGTEIEGTVTFESDDIVRIEVEISGSIKETKTLSRADVAKVLRTPPDVVAFNKINEMVPTGSLLKPADYRTMIETGPKDFLAKHADSRHKEKVEEILTTLEEELDKVERGFIKLEEDWISPQDQREYESRVEARKLLLRMEDYAESGDPHAAIGAMRFFETLESNYYGTPAFARAVPIALEVVPSLGRRLESMSSNVEARNAQWERDKNALSEYDRKQLEQARANEEAQYKAGLAEDKKKGLKWVRLNPNSKESIDGYIALATEEYKRLQSYDADALVKQAEMLVKADDLIGEKRFDLAARKLDEASEVNVKLGDDSSRKKSRRKKGGSSYISVLSEKLKTRREEAEAARKAREEAKDSEEAAAALRKKQERQEKNAEKAGEEGEEEATEDSEEEKAAKADAFSALAQASSGKKAEEEEDEEKSGDEEKDEESAADKDDDRDRRPPPDAGGGFPWKLLVPILSVLLIVVVVVLKVLGIGGKKDDEEDEEEDEGEGEK